MDDQIKIIQLPPERWAEYKRLRLSSLKNNPEAFVTTYDEAIAYPDEYWQKRLESPTQLFAFAQQNNQLIGMAAAFWEDKPISKHVANIISVYVEPAFRQRKIGTQLLTTFIELLKGIPQIKKVKLQAYAQNTNAINLYQKLGFTIVGTLKAEYYLDNQYQDDVLLEKLFL